MSKQEEILDDISSMIYSCLFGISRYEILLEYKHHIPDGWVDLWEDEDANMCDHLSVSALNCLNGAEKAVLKHIETHGRNGLLTAFVPDLYRIIEPYKVEGLVIWEDEV